MCHQAFNPPVLSELLYTLPVLLHALYIEIRLVAFSHIAIHSVKADVGGQHAENKRMFTALSRTAFFQDKGKYREQQRIK